MAGSDDTAFLPPRRLRLPKGRGQWRVVFEPTLDHKNHLTSIVDDVAAYGRRLAGLLDVADVPHGCVRGRSPLSMARAHVGCWAWTVSIDLRHAFDSVGHLLVGYPQRTWPAAFLDGRPPQGYPTSPALCNLALVSLDHAIVDELATRGWERGENCVYTRYVDDCVVSGNGDPTQAVEALAVAVESVGLRIHPQKTRTQYRRHARAVIVGLSVGPYDVRAPRRTRRRLRAAQHQAAAAPLYTLLRKKAAGLAEWCRAGGPTPVSRPLECAVARPQIALTTAEVTTAVVRARCPDRHCGWAQEVVCPIHRPGRRIPPTVGSDAIRMPCSTMERAAHLELDTQATVISADASLAEALSVTAESTAVGTQPDNEGTSAPEPSLGCLLSAPAASQPTPHPDTSTLSHSPTTVTGDNSSLGIEQLSRAQLLADRRAQAQARRSLVAVQQRRDDMYRHGIVPGTDPQEILRTVGPWKWQYQRCREVGLDDLTARFKRLELR